MSVRQRRKVDAGPRPMKLGKETMINGSTRWSWPPLLSKQTDMEMEKG